VDPSASASASPSGSAGPSSSATATGGDLRVSYHVDRGLLGAKSTISVTVTNQGKAEVPSWSVIMGMSGVTLIVTVVAPVKHETKDGAHVFTSTGTGAVLEPGDTFGFTVGVTGLDRVTSCTANGRDCTQT
jgi:hypothetical protein